MLSNAPAIGQQTNWEQWPYHFTQLLAPKLTVSRPPSDGCIYTWPGYQRPEPADPAALHSKPPTARARTTSPYLYVLRLRRRDDGARRSSGRLADRAARGRSRLRAGRQRDRGRRRDPLPPGGFLEESRVPAEERHALQRAGHVYRRFPTSGGGTIERWSFTTRATRAAQRAMGLYGEADPRTTCARRPADLPAPPHPEGLARALSRTTSGGTPARITTRGLSDRPTGARAVRRLGLPKLPLQPRARWSAHAHDAQDPHRGGARCGSRSSSRASGWARCPTRADADAASPSLVACSRPASARADRPSALCGVGGRRRPDRREAARTSPGPGALRRLGGRGTAAGAARADFTLTIRTASPSPRLAARPAGRLRLRLLDLPRHLSGAGADDPRRARRPAGPTRASIGISVDPVNDTRSAPRPSCSSSR